MKFTANSKEFEKLLAKVIPAAPQRTPMQILENFLFTVEGGSLTVMATDLEISLSAAMDVGADEDASFAVPAKLLHDFVRTLGDASIEFSTTSDDRLRLKTDFGEYAIAYQPPDEFPKAPERENDGEIVLDGKRLRRAFEKTSFAISREAMRPAMTGELVELSDEGMRFVATDGLRLARYHDPKVTFDGARQLVIPEKAVVALQKLAGDGEAKMTFGETIVSFDLGDLTMTSRLIKHRYPRLQQRHPVGERERDDDQTLGTLGDGQADVPLLLVEFPAGSVNDRQRKFKGERPRSGQRVERRREHHVRL